MARWLNDEEQHLWRQLLALSSEVRNRLNRQLQDSCGLSLSDYDVLVALTESPGGRRRMFQLAATLRWEQSRLSHQAARMARRGLLRRLECADDARGAFVEVTDRGRAAIEQAAPDHVEAVRSLLFDTLQPGELGALTALVDRLGARLRPAAAAGAKRRPGP